MINIKIDKSIKLNSDYSLFITFPYDNEIISVIRTFSQRYWNNNDKVWELPFSKLGEFTEALPNQEFDITGKYIELVNNSNKKVEIPDGFEFKTKPFQHQLEGFEYGLTYDRWLLGDSMGLGKSKQIIDIAVAKKLQKGYKHCLIVCGVNGLKWNWRNEVKTHSNEDSWILGQRRRKNGKLIVGSTKDKIADIDAILSGNKADLPYFIITNIESLRDESIVSKLAELCLNKTIGMIAVDEIHKTCNSTSQQAKGLLKLNSECKVAMTGTPLMNSPMDLYMILKWLGYEKHALYSFRNHYCVMGGYGGYQVIGYRHLDELQDRMNEIMLRRLKEDVLDLPEKTFIDEYVELTPKQSQIYKEVAMEISSNIDKIAMASNPLAELIRLRQATGYTGILSSTIKESAKLDRLEELVDEILQDGKKVVIFSNWTQMTDAIVERLSKHKINIGLITGQTKDSDRALIVDDFQNNPNSKVIVGTIGALGTGLTLTAGTVEIFTDHPWTMAAYSQAVDRCHRIGQTSNITIYNLLTKNTIDERIWEIVQQKGDMSEALIDGNVDKLALLNYLLS